MHVEPQWQSNPLNTQSSLFVHDGPASWTIHLGRVKRKNDGRWEWTVNPVKTMLLLSPECWPVKQLKQGVTKTEEEARAQVLRNWNQQGTKVQSYKLCVQYMEKVESGDVVYLTREVDGEEHRHYLVALIDHHGAERYFSFVDLDDSSRRLYRNDGLYRMTIRDLSLLLLSKQWSIK